MNKQEPLRLWFVAIVLIALLAASPLVSSAQNPGPASVVPTVSATNPAAGATGVTLNQAILVTFSQQMNPATMSANVVLEKPNGNLVSGGVAYYGRIAIFRPSVDLVPGTIYTIRVRAAASDMAGVALGKAYLSSFTTGATDDTTTPTVAFTIPADSAASVPTNQRIIAMFSEEMSPGSLDTTRFTVTKPGGAALIGTVAYAAGSVTFNPTYGLKSNTHYIATITTAARDSARNQMASSYMWSFDTGADPNVIKPTVISTNPETNATAVPIDQSINATFGEPINYASLTSGDFLLSWSGGNVAGTVTYFYDAPNNVTIASFVPSANLRANTEYTATITNEAQDLTGETLAGNTQSGDYVWQFMTGTATSQGRVALGAARNFAVLAAAMVSNTSTPTAITGDLGLWPGTAVAGFPPGTVNGTIHVNDPAAQAGESALGTAYDDAAGRTGPFTSAAGNIGGLVFYPGLYWSATSTMISGGGNLTLDAQGDPNAVFIFEIGSTLTTSSGFGLTLKNGAQPSNIFWQVGSSATIGTGSYFAGNILAKTSITLVSGAVLDGRVLAGAADLTGAVTMDDNTVVRPAP